MKKSCETCKYEHLSMRDLPCRECGSESKGSKKWESKCPGISFLRLNGLEPSLASCKDKLFEEIGEYLQLTGKGMKASGEQGKLFATPMMMIKELADVAQSAVTHMHVIADEAGINLDEVMIEHEQKLREKGYLR